MEVIRQKTRIHRNMLASRLLKFANSKQLIYMYILKHVNVLGLKSNRNQIANLLYACMLADILWLLNGLRFIDRSRTRL